MQIAFPIRVRCKRFDGIHRAFFNDMGYPTDKDVVRVGSICWNSPIGITVLIDNRDCFGLGIELYSSILSIRQMQGVPGTKIPEELKDWPTLLVEACMDYASYSNLSEVRIFKADQDFGFENPDVNPAEGQSLANAKKTHQDRMRRRYDRTASDLGFEKRKNIMCGKFPERGFNNHALSFFVITSRICSSANSLADPASLFCQCKIKLRPHKKHKTASSGGVCVFL